MHTPKCTQLHAMNTTRTEKELSGFVFDIQGLSVHDGPGCRTLIFLNGCSLNCFWCSNPEGISNVPLPLYFATKCILCNNCVEACGYDAITNSEGILKIDRNICSKCAERECLNTCYTDALKLGGREMTVSKLVSIIQRDRQFWGSEGGMTLTGGEPLLQAEFACEVLKQCHEAYIHTAIETCGNVPSQSFSKVMPYLDWMFFDLKHLNSEAHKNGTGAGNKLILENAKLVAREFKGRLIFRLPLIPGYNDSLENIMSVVNFLKECGKNEINVLPLHHLGREKYNVSGKEYTGMSFAVPSNNDLKNIKDIFTKEGITCYTGSETPF